MAENTQVGPAGGNKAAPRAEQPKNHNTNARDGRSGDGAGSGADASSSTLGKVGAIKPINP